VFSNWDAALGSVIAINQSAFNDAISAGHGTSSGWNGVIPGIAVVAIAGLTLAGARQRLSEYRRASAGQLESVATLRYHP
jgi:hypothetical protein